LLTARLDDLQTLAVQACGQRPAEFGDVVVGGKLGRVYP
jgi:hypothetical protein